MCEECQKEHDCSSNNIINFDAEKPSLEKEMIPFIAKSLMNRSNDDKSFIIDEKITDSDLLIILISSIIKNYYDYPNYNIIDNIKNFHEKLKNINNSVKEEFDIQNNKEIKNQLEYEALNNDEREYIKKIEIIAKNNDIKFLKNAILTNLEEINMSSNNIDNIEPLITAKFNNLKKLNLSINLINDSMIDVIAKLDFNNLENLNLSYNYFTQFNLFKSIEHFKNLKKFIIGSNDFTEDIDDLMKDKNLEYNLQTLEEIDLSLGVFSEESIKLLSKFKFEKLKILDLNSNNLTTLSFIDYLYFSKENDKSHNKDFIIIKDMDEIPLKKLNLQNNEISDISKLSKLKNIEEIKLDNNSIIINQSINIIVEKMKSLNQILLFGNQLDKKYA